MNRWSFALAVCCASALLASVSGDSTEAATAPIHQAHGLIYVELERKGSEPLLALLDTGANASAIDLRCSDELPVLERSEVIGTTGTLEVEMVSLSNLRLDTWTLPELRATRRDLGGLLRLEDRPVDMILGSDAFVDRVLTIDFRADELEVSATSPEPAADSCAMVLDNGIPAIEANLAGIDTWLRIDTGASLFDTNDIYINIPGHLWRGLRARDGKIQPTTHFQGTGANGRAVELPVAPVEDIALGPVTLERAFVIVQPEVGYFADPEAKGFVSNNFLRTLGRVTLDYCGELLHTKSGDGSPEP